MRSSKLVSALAVTLLVIIVLGCWLWWESYKCTVNWSRRSDLFPMPFYLFYLPHWAVVDLAITLIVFSSLGLVIMLIWREFDRESEKCSG